MTYKPLLVHIAKLKPALPVLLDLAGFACLVVGTAYLFGDWAWFTAGILLILAGYRAQA